MYYYERFPKKFSTFAASNLNSKQNVSKRVVRKLLKIAGYTIMAIIMILVMTSILISYSPIQDRMVEDANKAITDKIPAKTSIKNIRVNLLTMSASIRGVEIEDQQHRKMLELDKLTADLKLLPLFRGRFVLEGGEVRGLHALIVKPSDDEPANYQFIIDDFQKKKEEKPKKEKKDTVRRFSVDLRYLNIEDINLKYNDADVHLRRANYTKELTGGHSVVIEDAIANWNATTKKGREKRTAGVSILSGALTNKGEKLLTVKGLKYQTNNHKPRKNANKPKRGFFDMGHLDITADLRATINYVSTDSINATITRGFAADSIMGMDIKDLRLNIAANKQKAFITDLNVQQKSTTIRVPEGEITFPSKKKGIGLSYVGKNISGRVILKDISRTFAPVLSKFTLPLRVNLKLTGTDNSMEFRNVRVYTEDRKFVVASTGVMRNMKIAKDLKLHFEVIDMVAKPGIKDKIINQFVVKKFMMRQLYTLGTLKYHGSFDILWKKEQFRGLLNTEVGNINFELAIDNQEKYLSGKLNTEDVNMGKLFEVDGLGNIICNADFKIDISKPRTAAIRKEKGGKLPIGHADAYVKDCMYNTSHFKNLYANINSDGALATGDVEMRGRGAALVLNFSLANTDQMKKMKVKPSVKFLEQTKASAPSAQ